jgi:hypothetical protein
MAVGSLLEAAVEAERLERLGLKERLGPELSPEQREIKRLEALKKEKGEAIGVALRGAFGHVAKPLPLPRKK